MSNGTKIVDIKPHNKKVYIDIIRDVLIKKNGLFSFVLRCHNGLIRDYVLMETVKP